MASLFTGAYIPPAKFKRMIRDIANDSTSEEYQRLMWNELRKKINGLINRVNITNITIIVRELFAVNLIRGSGLLVSSLMKAQEISPSFTDRYAAVVCAINSRIASIGLLTINRLIIIYRRAFSNDDKPKCLASVRFIAHLINQEVVHEILGLQIILHLLEKPTPFSIEIAIGFIKECGAKLTDVAPRGINVVFDELRKLSFEAKLDSRSQDMIDVIHMIRRDGFKDHPAIREGLDLIEEKDKITHQVELDIPTRDDYKLELNHYKFDPNYKEIEDKYDDLKKVILGDDSDSDASVSEAESESDDSENEEEPSQKLIDATGAELVGLRRNIYLTIQSSLNSDECAHKLMKMNIKPELYDELCHMMLDCCAQQRTYVKFFGLLAERFCRLKRRDFSPRFEQIFKLCYESMHMFETNKIRNIAKFFAHLITSDSISWNVLSVIDMGMDTTTSLGRVFIKILFEEFVENMTLAKLEEKVRDPELSNCFAGLFPRDDPRKTRFAINFFTTLNLGSLTVDLRSLLDQ
ncbi:Pre-mRNA-splicing factor CWC22-like protein, partial [Fragariocoptes setiger]